MKKKILFFIEGIGGGGQQTFNYHFIKHLSKDLFEVQLCYFEDGSLRKNFEANTTNIFQLHPPPKNWIWATKNIFHILKMAFKLKQQLKNRQIELVVSNAPYTYFIACIGCWMAGVKHARMLGKEPSKEKSLWFWFSLFPFSKLTHLFLSFTYGNKELISKGVPQHKLLDILNAVDTELFKPTLNENQKQIKRQEFGIKENELVIGWCGRIADYMEVNNTVDMLAELLKLNFHEFKFFCIGDGPWMKEFKQMVKEKGLENYTLYLGWQPIESVIELLQCTHIMPLLDYDPIGGSIVREAMSVGSVVLSVNGKSGFQAEWVKHNVNGVMVEPENYRVEAAKQCIALQNDRERLNRIALAGRAYAVNNLAFTNKSKIFEQAVLKIL